MSMNSSELYDKLADTLESNIKTSIELKNHITILMNRLKHTEEFYNLMMKVSTEFTNINTAQKNFAQNITINNLEHEKYSIDTVGEEEEVVEEEEEEVEVVDEEEEEEVEVVDEEEEEVEVVDEEEEEEEVEVVDDEEEEEEEEEIFVVEIKVNKKNVDFYTNNEINGEIYEINSDESIGKQIGVFKNSKPLFD